MAPRRNGLCSSWVDAIVREVRYALRSLARTPAFSLTAVVVLALGLGANTAVFGLVNLLLFRPMPGASQPGAVVGVYSRDPVRPDSYRSFSYTDYEEIRDRVGVLGEVAALRSWRVGVMEGEASRRTKAPW